MFSKLFLPILLILVSASTTYAQQGDGQSAVVLDEDVWVTFYDLPSRRFRAIRAAILTIGGGPAACSVLLPSATCPWLPIISPSRPRGRRSFFRSR